MRPTRAEAWFRAVEAILRSGPAQWGYNGKFRVDLLADQIVKDAEKRGYLSPDLPGQGPYREDGRS